MKRIFYFYILIAVCGSFVMQPISARADDDAPSFSLDVPGLTPDQPEGHPTLTSPEYIAMTYYKLARQTPDFAAWAQDMDAYKAANSFDQPTIQEQEEDKLKQAFSLLTLKEPLIMTMKVKMSPYNAVNQGFFILNFKKTTFFPATFHDRSYALVPLGLVDKQWMKIDDPQSAQTIETAARADKDRLLDMIFFLTPQFSDTSSAVTIEGKEYWPLVVEVKRMMLFGPDGSLLWQSDTAASDPGHMKILNLYH